MHGMLFIHFAIIYGTYRFLFCFVFLVFILKTLLTLHVSYYYMHKIFDPFLKYFCSLALESILFNFQHIFYHMKHFQWCAAAVVYFFSFLYHSGHRIVCPLCSIKFNIFAHTTLSHAKCNKYCTCILHIA